MKTYKAVFRPDDNGWWFIDVPELPGCHSQARAIASGRDHIREAISLVANVDLDTFDVEVDYELPKAQQAAVAKARLARERATEAAQATETAVRALQQGSAKLGVRDVAELVGVSHQRVAQIMKRPRPDVAHLPRNTPLGAHAGCHGHHPPSGAHRPPRTSSR